MFRSFGFIRVKMQGVDVMGFQGEFVGYSQLGELRVG
jgi:hypothetical protein